MNNEERWTLQSSFPFELPIGHYEVHASHGLKASSVLQNIRDGQEVMACRFIADKGTV